MSFQKQLSALITDLRGRKIMSQHVLVFQQNGSGLRKISGIEKYGGGLFDIEIFNIDQSLPPVIDETAPYLPGTICADLVLDFLRHPISHTIWQNAVLGKIFPLWPPARRKDARAS